MSEEVDRGVAAAGVRLTVRVLGYSSEHDAVLTGTALQAGAGHHGPGTSPPTGPAPPGGPAGFIPGDRDASADLDGHRPTGRRFIVRRSVALWDSPAWFTGS